MDSTASAVSVGAANLKLNFDYDSQGRRIRKQVAHWSASQWQTTNDLRFVYDGWNLTAEYDGTNVVRSYTWGTDLSGSMQGAGGVGGLLAMRVHSGATAGEYVFAYDGNGNVIALVNTATGVEAARYEYSPFGQLLRATGPLALENKFRFSTKYCDDETGYYYYGFRYYNADLGRWLNHDPTAERFSIQLYIAVNNDVIKH